MGIFSSIKQAIFGKDDKPEAKPANRNPQVSGTTLGQASNRPATAGQGHAVSEVDVERRLDMMEGAEDLNWRTSIVDLLKLLDIDSSYQNRKELAQELGNKDYEGSAEDNIRLHRQTMQELARNGGKVPAEFLD